VGAHYADVSYFLTHPVTASSAGGILEAVGSANFDQYGFQIDLTTRWWSTRLYLLAALANRLTAVRRIVFVERRAKAATEPDGTYEHVEEFVGQLSTTTILTTLEPKFAQYAKFAGELRGRSVEYNDRETEIRANFELWVRSFDDEPGGQSTLIQQAMLGSGKPVLYMQVPDSGPAGVLSSVRDAFETFGVDTSQVPVPTTLSSFAKTVGQLARRGYIVVLDEFQYFHRKALAEFTSHLQREVDQLSADAAKVPGGLFVLGSTHAELTSLLEDRAAPLQSHHNVDIKHLDIASVLEILRAHSDASPERLLLLWNLFEGVPKFYRDCFEQGVLGAARDDLLLKIFFQSSAPQRSRQLVPPRTARPLRYCPQVHRPSTWLHEWGLGQLRSTSKPRARGTNLWLY